MAFFINYKFMESRTLTVQEELHRLFEENKRQKDIIEKIIVAVQKLNDEDRWNLESILNLQK